MYPHKIRYVKESSGVRSTTESFKYNKCCDISSSSSKPLVLIKEQYNNTYTQPFRKVKIPLDKRVIERTYSAVRTSSYVKRSSVAPDKRSDAKLIDKKVIKVPYIAPIATNVIDEHQEDEQTQGQGSEFEQVDHQKRRKSITYFELSSPNDTICTNNSELYTQVMLTPLPLLNKAQQLKVLVNGQFEEREMTIDITQIPMDFKVQRIAELLNEMYYNQFGHYFKHPTLSILVGRLQTKKLAFDMLKYELVAWVLKGALGKDQLIILNEQS